MSTGVGWDGCPSCFGCKICNKLKGDCCGDCTHTSKFTMKSVHVCPTCHCAGGVVGSLYSNLVCNCAHNCDEEASG